VCVPSETSLAVAGDCLYPHLENTSTPLFRYSTAYTVPGRLKAGLRSRSFSLSLSLAWSATVLPRSGLHTASAAWSALGCFGGAALWRRWWQAELYMNLTQR
jgi:hypothetical protein